MIKPGIGLLIITMVFIACNWAAFLALLIPITGKAGMVLGFAAFGAALGGGKQMKSVAGGSTEAPNKKKILEVYISNDYDRFHFITGNRDIDEPHVQELVDSIKEIGYLNNPIIVNSKYQIIDGQHRYLACFQLNLPIMFVIDDDATIADTQRMNSLMNNWDVNDYLESHIKMEHPEYIKYKQFLEKWGFGHATNTVLLTGSEDRKTIAKAFERGNFVIKRWTEANKIAEIVHDFKPYYDRFKQRGFVLAMRQLFKSNGYKHEIMLKKLEFRASLLVPQVTEIMYAQLLVEEVYNFRTNINEKMVVIKEGKNKYHITLMSKHNHG